MARFRLTDRHDWAATVLRVVLVVGALVFALAVLRPRYGWLPTTVFVVVSLLTLVRWYSQSYGFRCASCGHVFQVPTTVNFFTPSGVAKNPDGTYYGWKALTCPRCEKRSRARVLKKADLSHVDQRLK